MRVGESEDSSDGRRSLVRPDRRAAAAPSSQPSRMPACATDPSSACMCKGVRTDRAVPAAGVQSMNQIRPIITSLLSCLSAFTGRFNTTRRDLPCSCSLGRPYSQCPYHTTHTQLHPFHHSTTDISPHQSTQAISVHGNPNRGGVQSPVSQSASHDKMAPPATAIRHSQRPLQLGPLGLPLLLLLLIFAWQDDANTRGGVQAFLLPAAGPSRCTAVGYPSSSSAAAAAAGG